MRNTSFRVVGVAMVALALSSGVTLAQVTETLTFEAPYPFLVSGREMPAGGYELDLLWRSPGLMQLRNLQTEESIFIQSISRVSERADGEALLVFDKYQETYYLAEVHVPGVDGFHLQGAPGKHTHTRVTANR
jgi:hypothetical protein